MGRGGEKFSNYTNWLPLILLSCRFKTETEALEGFSAIALQATAVAPVTSQPALYSVQTFKKKKKKPQCLHYPGVTENSHKHATKRAQFDCSSSVFWS